MKDTPADRAAPRERLIESLDAMFAEPIDPRTTLTRWRENSSASAARATPSDRTSSISATPPRAACALTLDAGHYHPTETIADKLSAVLAFLPAVVLHVSRGVRWDSDHVVVAGDDVDAIAQELVRGEFLGGRTSGSTISTRASIASPRGLSAREA